MGDERKPVVERLKEARHTATDKLDEVLLSATLVRSLQTVDDRVMKSVKVCSCPVSQRRSQLLKSLKFAPCPVSQCPSQLLQSVKDCSVSGLSRSFPNIAIR